MSEATVATGSWRELFGRDRLRTSTLLAGGIALYATNSSSPSACCQHGRRHRRATVYAWVITVYLVGSVVAATAVNPLLMRCGPRASYLATLTLFGVGTVGCAIAPTMELLLVARTVQGAAGGCSQVSAMR